MVEGLHEDSCQPRSARGPATVRAAPRPGRLALALFRLPLNAYRHDADRLMGRTFVQLAHLGRKTGQPHDAVATVCATTKPSRTAVICAA